MCSIKVGAVQVLVTDNNLIMQAIVLISLSLAALVSGYLEEAPFEVTKEYDEWEVRRYPATRWISTEAQDVMPHDGGEHSKVIDIILL